MCGPHTADAQTPSSVLKKKNVFERYRGYRYRGYRYSIQRRQLLHYTLYSICRDTVYCIKKKMRDTEDADTEDTDTAVYRNASYCIINFSCVGIIQHTAAPAPVLVELNRHTCYIYIRHTCYIYISWAHSTHRDTCYCIELINLTSVDSLQYAETPASDIMRCT